MRYRTKLSPGPVFVSKNCPSKLMSRSSALLISRAESMRVECRYMVAGQNIPTLSVRNAAQLLQCLGRAVVTYRKQKRNRVFHQPIIQVHHEFLTALSKAMLSFKEKLSSCNAALTQHWNGQQKSPNAEICFFHIKLYKDIDLTAHSRLSFLC